MTLTEIREKKQERKKLFERAKALVDGAKAAGREMTAEERSEFDSLMSDVEARGKTIETEERLLAAETGASLAGVGSRALLATEESEAAPQAARFVDVATGRELRTFRAGDRITFPEQDRSGLSPEEASALSLGKFLRGLATGDWRGAELERRALGEATTGAGGAMVPAVLVGNVITAVAKRLAIMNAGATLLTLENGNAKIARVTGTPTAAWYAENAEIIGSDMTFDLVDLKAKKCAALVLASRELVHDAVNAASVLEQAMVDAVTAAVDAACLTGDGLSNNVKGLLHIAGITQTDLAAAAINLDTILTGYYELLGADAEDNITLIHNARVAVALDKLKAATTGEYLLGTAPPSWARIKKILTTQIATTAGVPPALDTTTIYLGAFRQALIAAVSAVEVSFGQEGAGAFEHDQIAFKTVWRLDFNVARTNHFRILTNAGV